MATRKDLGTAVTKVERGLVKADPTPSADDANEGDTNVQTITKELGATARRLIPSFNMHPLVQSILILSASVVAIVLGGEGSAALLSALAKVLSSSVLVVGMAIFALLTLILAISAVWIVVSRNQRQGVALQAHKDREYPGRASSTRPRETEQFFRRRFQNANALPDDSGESVDQSALDSTELGTQGD